MRITFVLPPVGMSGGSRVIAIYARLLAERGHDVLVVSQAPRPKTRVQAWRQRLGLGGPPRAPSHFDGLPIKHHVLQRRRPIVDADLPDADVVIATWWETAEWVATFSPRKGAKAYLVQGHEIWTPIPVERSRATYRLPMHKIAVSQWLTDVMASEYGQPGVPVVENSIDHQQFFAPPRTKQSRPTIGFLYSAGHLKGADIAWRVVQQLRMQWPQLRVVSFGMDALDASMQGVVEFHRNPAQDKLRELYAMCDVWLSASRSEGFNLTAMEAMACRAPVVATRTGWPVHAIVDGVNGYCVDVDDEQALLRAAANVLSLSDDAWQAMSKSAFATVEHSSWGACVDALERALRDAASARHRDASAQEAAIGV